MSFPKLRSPFLPDSAHTLSPRVQISAMFMAVGIIFFSYLVTFVLESPIRYALSLAKVEWVFYMRDVAVFVTVGAIVFWGLVNARTNWLLIVIVDVLLLHSFVSLIYVGNVFQLGFGLKLFLPLIFGVACFTFLHGRLELLKTPFAVLFWLACIGITVNFFTDFPWKGLEYNVGNATLMGVKEWYSGGYRRLYGFSRTSANVAVQVLILGSFLVIFLHGKLIKVMVWTAAGVAIILSTTKGVFFAYILMTAFFVARYTSPATQQHFIRGLVLLLAVIIILPCISFFAEPRDEWVKAILASPLRSFGERIAMMWPDGLELVLDKGNVLLGRGVGGAGVAQLLFEGGAYHPGDNLFIYGYLLFGVLIVPYLTIIVFTAQKLRPQSNQEDAFYATVILAYLTYGITTSVAESGEFQLFFGLVLGRILQVTRIKRETSYAQTNRSRKYLPTA